MSPSQLLRCSLLLLFFCAGARGSDFIIAISVDGLGSSYLQSLLDEQLLPNFDRLQRESAWTFNARTDFDHTTTMPNHASMLTGRPVLNKFGSSLTGHLWTGDGDPGTATLHSNRGFYVSSVFDVVHDSGGRTGVYVSKGKLRLFRDSYDSVNGAPHPVYGQNKIDSYRFDTSPVITEAWAWAMNLSPFHFTFLHYADPDLAGHDYGWGGSEFNNAVVAVDGFLGDVFNVVDSHLTLRGRTSIILTSDHGGKGTSHADASEPLSYTIPFFVWGPEVTRGVDLYALNSQRRTDPGTGRPDYSTTNVPIRTGDLANLSLTMLGLGAVPESTTNGVQDLVFSAVPGDANLDRKVDIADLGILAANWQQSAVGWMDGDFSQDGTVTIADLGILAANWQGGAGSLGFEEALAMSGMGAVVIPEAGGAVMVVLGMSMALMRRRRGPLGLSGSARVCDGIGLPIRGSMA